MEPGWYCEAGLNKDDTLHIKTMNRKSLDANKKRRKKLRALRKGYDDKNLDEEGETYAPGAF